MAFDPKDTRNLVIALGLGAVAGAAIIQSHHDEHAKSQAEKDDPEGTEWICNIVWDLLDDWEPPDMECEDDYSEHLFRYTPLPSTPGLQDTHLFRIRPDRPMHEPTSLENDLTKNHGNLNVTVIVQPKHH